MLGAMARWGKMRRGAVTRTNLLAAHVRTGLLQTTSYIHRSTVCRLCLLNRCMDYPTRHTSTQRRLTGVAPWYVVSDQEWGLNPSRVIVTAELCGVPCPRIPHL